MTKHVEIPGYDLEETVPFSEMYVEIPGYEPPPRDATQVTLKTTEALKEQLTSEISALIKQRDELLAERTQLILEVRLGRAVLADQNKLFCEIPGA